MKLRFLYSVILFMASALHLHAESHKGYAGELFASPDGKYSVVTLQNDPCESGREDIQDAFIQFRLQSSGAVVKELHESYARAISAVWSPDSRMVAISMQIDPHESRVRVFRVSDKGLSELAIPQLHIRSLVHSEDPASKLVFQFSSAVADKWQDSACLDITVAGSARLFGADGTDNGYLSAAYSVTIEINENSGVVLATRKTQWETNK